MAYAGPGVVPPESMRAHEMSAAIARPRRSASAASRSSRSAKRRMETSIIYSSLPRAVLRRFTHVRVQVKRLAPAQHVNRDRRAGFACRDAGERLLGAAQRCAVEGDENVTRLQPRLLAGAADVEI